jgi:hypothetical protein
MKLQKILFSFDGRIGITVTVHLIRPECLVHCHRNLVISLGYASSMATFNGTFVRIDRARPPIALEPVGELVEVSVLDGARLAQVRAFPVSPCPNHKSRL